MNKKRQFAGNRLFNFCLVLVLFFGWGSMSSFMENDTSWGWGLGAIALLLTVLSTLLTPYCYAFDREGVSLCYVFLPVERYLWKDIYAIEVEDTSTSSKSSIFVVFFSYVFAIKGKNVGKQRFYMNGHVRKTLRTKKLFEKYWDGTITGYLFEDIKEWINKRKAKKQKEIKQHFTNEIVPLEREIRSYARQWLKPFVDQAKPFGLDIKAKFVYITKDLKEYNSRPNKGYTYALVAEIAHFFNETDKNLIVDVSVDLLYVRLGKTAYRGVKNEHAQKEIESTISDVLNEIQQNGIEVFFQEQ